MLWAWGVEAAAELQHADETSGGSEGHDAARGDLDSAERDYWADDCACEEGRCSIDGACCTCVVPLCVHCCCHQAGLNESEAEQCNDVANHDDWQGEAEREAECKAE